MNTPYDPMSIAEGIVYVKPVDVSDLPVEVQEQAGDLTQLFAVHGADGTQLALVANRQLAYTLALQNDMVPVAVH